jgi:hypothetical protein
LPAALNSIGIFGSSLDHKILIDCRLQPVTTILDAGNTNGRDIRGSQWKHFNFVFQVRRCLGRQVALMGKGFAQKTPRVENKKKKRRTDREKSNTTYSTAPQQNKDD